MLKDLFLNATILIACISIGNQILINKELTPCSSFRLKMFFGAMSGIMGIFLMLNSVNVMPGVILDFRNIAIILSAVYCGTAAAIVTGMLIAIFRLFFMGFDFFSQAGALTAIVMALGCGLLAKLPCSKTKKWSIMALLALIVPVITYTLKISDRMMLYKTVFIYWISTLVVLVLVYIYISYLDISKSVYSKYKFNSSKDHLTGLNNVRQFDAEFNKLIKRLNEITSISIFFIDIDHFKQVNDRYGHQNGDRVLEDLGKILLANCSYSDIVSRNGGEEFSVLLVDCPQVQLLRVAERIRRAVQSHSFVLFGGEQIKITVSIGIATYPYSVTDINELVQKADSALYEAKHTGRNKVVMVS